MAFKQATVNASKVAATLTNYPAYVDLSRVGITTLAEAQSVRVYTDSAKMVEIAREIVSATEMHCKIPSLTTTTTIYIDYDGVRADYAVTDTYGRNAVWADYDVVYHFDAIVSGVWVNSTGGTNGSASTLTDVGASIPTETTGAINGGGNFGTVSNKRGIDTTIAAQLTTALANDSRWTQQFWFRVNGNPSTAMIWTEGASSSGFYNYAGMNTNGTVLTKLRGGTTQITASSFANNTWHMLHWVKNGNTSSDRYINAGGKQTATGSGTQTTDENVVIGGIDRSTFQNAVKDLIDEFRLRKSDISENWITTEYNNQSDEATFWGTWTDVNSEAPTPSGMMMWW